MSTIPESVRAVLESSALAHLVTLEPDGSPQVSIVWVGLDGDEIVAGHLAERRKVRNIRDDPRVAVSFETSGYNERGLVEYLVIHGMARISAGALPLFSSGSLTLTLGLRFSSHRLRLPYPVTSPTSLSTGSRASGHGQGS